MKTVKIETKNIGKTTEIKVPNKIKTLGQLLNYLKSKI